MTKKAGASWTDKKGTWLTYRPDIKVLDCTIRDGGLVNNSQFTDEFVRAVYQALVAAGVDYMEIGYKGDRKIYSPAEYGCWKHCHEDDIRRIVGENKTGMKLSAMADAERTNYHEDIIPKDQSVLDMIRVATYIHQIPTAVDMIKAAHDKGYETTLNLMSVSVVPEHELDEALAILAKTEVDVIYVVDSFGALYSEEIQALTRKFVEFAKAAGKKVGIHTHNNQQLAYANTIDSADPGRELFGFDDHGAGTGRRQLRDGTPAGIPEKSEIPYPADLGMHSGAFPAAARKDLLGLRHPADDYRADEHAPAQRDRFSGGREQQGLCRVL